MAKERKLNLSSFNPEYAEYVERENPEKYASNPVFAELNAQTQARELARQIGDEEWRKGNTKYAFEAYEAASVPPSEILEKAIALLKSAALQKKWLLALKRTDELVGCGHNWWIEYCGNKNCAKCVAREIINQKYAPQIYELLNWDEPEEKVTTFDNRIQRNYYALFVMKEDKKEKNFYKAAAVAALKLVKRLDTVYVVENQER